MAIKRFFIFIQLSDKQGASGTKKLFMGVLGGPEEKKNYAGTGSYRQKHFFTWRKKFLVNED